MKFEVGGKTRFLLAASFLGTAAESMLVPIYAPLAHRAGGSLMDTGVGLALFSITTGLFVITAGMTQWFRNHIRTLLVLGFLLAGVGGFSFIDVEQGWVFATLALACVIMLSSGIFASWLLVLQIGVSPSEKP